MKLKTVFVVVLGLALTFSSVAWCRPVVGGSHGRGAPHGFPGARALAALDLDETQQAEMDNIREIYEPQFEELFTEMMTLRKEIVVLLFAETIDEDALLEANQNAADKMESIRSLEQERILEIKAILTAEQILQLQELIQSRMDQIETSVQ